jgi:hypothetical protein
VVLQEARPRSYFALRQLALQLQLAQPLTEDFPRRSAAQFIGRRQHLRLAIAQVNQLDHNLTT